jgi:hypothetical protein
MEDLESCIMILHDARFANDFVSSMPRDALGSVAPRNELFLGVHDAQSCGQTLQDAAIDFRIVGKRHASRAVGSC